MITTIRAYSMITTYILLEQIKTKLFLNNYDVKTEINAQKCRSSQFW